MTNFNYRSQMEPVGRQESINGKNRFCLVFWCQTASRRYLTRSVKAEGFTHCNREGNYVFQLQLGSVLESLAKSFYYPLRVNLSL